VARVAALLRGLPAEGAAGAGLPRPAGDAAAGLRQGRRPARRALRRRGLPARPPAGLPRGASPAAAALDERAVRLADDPVLSADGASDRGRVVAPGGGLRLPRA